MAKISLTTIASGYLRASAINADNTVIENAIDNTVSRDGTAPNTMLAALDMAGQRIENLPTAVADAEPVTLAQIAALVTTSTTLTQSVLAGFLWPRTSEETTAGVTPTALQYPPGNLRRYGAVGDGTTDDWQALEDAIASHPEKMYAPAGTYWLNGSGHGGVGNILPTATRISIRGDGPTVSIFKEAKIRAEVGTPVTNYSVQDVGFIESGNPLYMHTANVVAISNCHFASDTTLAAPRCIQMFITTNVLIDHCYFDVFQDGVRLGDAAASNQYVTISNCIFNNENNTTAEWASGVNVSACNDLTVVNNIFHDQPLIGATLSYGCYEGDGALSTRRNENLVYKGNTYNNMGQAGIYIHDAHNVLIDSNTFWNSGAGDYTNGRRAVIIGGDVDPVDASIQDRITITNNICEVMARMTIGDTPANPVSQVVLAGNQCEDSSAEMFRLHEIIHLDVHDNIIKNVDNTGITLNGCDHAKVHDNLMIDCNQDNEASGNSENNAGIRYTNSGIRNEIYDNTTVNIAANGAHYCVSINSHTIGVQYHGNKGFGLQTATYATSLTAAPTTGTWELDDFVPNVFPTAATAGTKGWRCVAAGTPGTWVTEGPVKGLVALDNTGTPSVLSGTNFLTGGTTAITDFDDGQLGQTIRIKAAHTVDVTAGAAIKLAVAGTYTMTDSDTLQLTMYVDQVWSEDTRSVNVP